MDKPMTNEDIAIDYVKEIIHHIDNGDIGTARIICDLLNEHLTGDTSWRADTDTCGNCRATFINGAEHNCV